MMMSSVAKHDAMPDENDASDPADWWKKEPRDDVDDSDLDAGIA
jgi:hypothetical protein